MQQKPETAVLSLLYQGAERSVLVTAFAAFLLCFSFLADPVASSLRGPWLDQAFSDVLTQRCGKMVTVQNVRFAGWSDIYFSRLEIDSAEGRIMLRCSQGSIRLENPRFWETWMFETRVQLHHVVLFNEYFKNSSHFQPWSRFLRKPILIHQLMLKVIQSKERILLKIIKSESADVHLDGGLVVDPQGRVQDGLRVSFSPWMILRALF